MTSKNGVSFHLPKQLRRAAAGVEQQGAASRRDTLRRWKKASASRPGFQRYSQRANQWDSQNHSARQAPPHPALVHPSSRFSILKIGTKLPGFSLHHSWHLAGRDGTLPYSSMPPCHCMCTVCKHKQEHRDRDVPAQNTTGTRNS